MCLNVCYLVHFQIKDQHRCSPVAESSLKCGFYLQFTKQRLKRKWVFFHMFCFQCKNPSPSTDVLHFCLIELWLALIGPPLFVNGDTDWEMSFMRLAPAQIKGPIIVKWPAVTIPGHIALWRSQH